MSEPQNPAARRPSGPTTFDRPDAPSGSSSDQPKIHIRDLHKSFGPKVVLDGLSLDVAPAESLVIIGGSGTGKSVMLKHIIGLLKPDSGLVEVDGIRVDTLGNR